MAGRNMNERLKYLRRLNDKSYPIRKLYSRKYGYIWYNQD